MSEGNLTLNCPDPCPGTDVEHSLWVVQSSSTQFAILTETENVVEHIQPVCTRC